MGEVIVAKNFPQPAQYTVFVRDLELPRGPVGGPLSLSVELKVDVPPDIHADRYKYVVCYDRIVKGAKAFAESEGAADLMLLGERIAQHCFDDERVGEVRISLTPVRGLNGGTSGIELRRARLKTAARDRGPVRIAANA